MQVTGGQTFEGKAGELTPLDVIKQMKPVEAFYFAKVKIYGEEGQALELHDADKLDGDPGAAQNWIIQDLYRPLEGDCERSLLEFKDTK